MSSIGNHRDGSGHRGRRVVREAVAGGGAGAWQWQSSSGGIPVLELIRTRARAWRSSIVGGVAVLESPDRQEEAALYPICLDPMETGPAFVDKPVRRLAGRRDLNCLGLNADALHLAAHLFVVDAGHCGAEGMVFETIQHLWDETVSQEQWCDIIISVMKLMNPTNGPSAQAVADEYEACIEGY